MPEFWMVKNQFGKLSAEDDGAKGYMAKLKNGDAVLVKVRKPRNVQFHRKYFAMLQTVFENQERYEDFEAFRAEVVMRAGYWKAHHHVSGKISYDAQSLAFDKMDELAFSELYDKSIDVILEHFLPETNRDELEEAVLDFAG